MDPALKNRIEAVLYATGREMTSDEIAGMAGIGSTGIIKEILLALKAEYALRETGLEIKEEEGKWKLAIKKEHLSVTESLLSNTEMDLPTQKTLAMIAFKNPALQSHIIKARGNKAYDHIQFLKDNEFIISEKSGRTRALKLTQKFYDYFDVVASEFKEKMESIAGKEDKEQIEDAMKLLFPK